MRRSGSTVFLLLNRPLAILKVTGTKCLPTPIVASRIIIPGAMVIMLLDPASIRR